MRTNIKSQYIMLFSISVLVFSDLYFRNYLLTRDVFYDFFSNQMSNEQIENFINNQEKWSFLIYIIIPTIYILKISLTSICIYIGFYFYQNDKIRLGDIMGKVIKADLIFLIPILLKTLWFSLGDINFNLEDFQYFSPISLLNIFEVSMIQKWLIYPLQAINIFEVAFWIILGYQLKTFLKNDFTKSFKLVLASYGSGFIIWIIFVVFLTLNLT